MIHNDNINNRLKVHYNRFHTHRKISSQLMTTTLSREMKEFWEILGLLLTGVEV